MVNVVSFFSGCGGSSLGYHLAGCNVILAADWEEKAVQTYKLNFPESKAIVADIRKMNRKTVDNLINGKIIDILDGSPPCTPFSMSGQREKKWGKSYVASSMTQSQRTDDLFFEFIRMIKETLPKIFIAENVKGLIMGVSKGYYNTILGKMRDLDYHVEPFCLNAKYYGVPQSRERIIFIGFRKGITLNNKVKMIRKPIITVNEAIEDVKSNPDELRIAFASFNNSQNASEYLKIKPGQGHPVHFNVRRLKNDVASNTILTHGSSLLHPLENRFMTLSELKALSSFPKNFKFLSISDGIVRLGNAVPPNLMRSIAEYAIKKADLI